MPGSEAKIFPTSEFLIPLNQVDNWQLILTVIGALIGLLITFFAFLGAGMLAMLGYFLRNFHSEYKFDKAKTELREEKMDARIQSLSDVWGAKLAELVEKIGEKINQLPKGSDNLTQAMMQMEKDHHNRINEHSQRIQNNYTRIEQVAVRTHDIENAVSPFIIRQQMKDRKEEVESKNNL